MTAETFPGNEYAATGHFSAEQVPSRWAPETDAAVATAYATLALAYEQRIANEIALEQLRAQPAATGRRGAAERIQARLHPADPEPARDYLLENYAAVRFELLRADVEKIERKMQRINGNKPDPVIRAVLDLIDQHAADSGRGAGQ